MRVITPDQDRTQKSFPPQAESSTMPSPTSQNRSLTFVFSRTFVKHEFGLVI